MIFKRSIFVIIMIIVTVLSACNNEKVDVNNNKNNENEENYTINVAKTDLPIVEDKITVEVFAGMGVKYTNDLKDVRGYEKFEEITNVEIDWKQISNDSIDEKRNLALSGGNLPDVFYASAIPKLDILKYGQQGTLIKLNSLIDEYAPNLTALMEENPEIRQAITLPDGNIYTLPYLSSPDSQSVRTYPILYFNQNVLDELGISKPETTDEFYKYLTTVKEKSISDQNGSEVVPYGSPQIDDLIGWLEGSFGVGNRGRPFIDKEPDSEEVRFYPIDDDYKELLEYMHKLYDEGLIAQNIFSIEKDQFV